ncbi:hypothetical protein GL284_16405, partial [Paracoccus sp. DK608]|nr:hypothetical protein [Paracoccus shanxieyensis]MTH89103.1 hypothetical protein [Paracoccus shanxieyensis]
MAGPQFFHLQSYSRKPNKAGQSIAQVPGEAARLPEFSQHVPEPKPCRVIFGLSPAEVQTRHDEMVAAGRCEVTLKDGTTAIRGIRKDRHTLMTAVASYPDSAPRRGVGAPTLGEVRACSGGHGGQPDGWIVGHTGERFKAH